MEIAEEVQLQLIDLLDEDKVSNEHLKLIFDELKAYFKRDLLSRKRSDDDTLIAESNQFLSALNSTNASILNQFKNKYSSPIAKYQSALLILLMEASRKHLDDMELSHYLEEYGSGVSSPRYGIISKFYLTCLNQLNLQGFVQSGASSFPEYHNIQWRLDYVIQTTSVNRYNDILYTIRLVSDNMDTKPIEFTCTKAQLQDLHATLKDAETQVSRLVKN